MELFQYASNPWGQEVLVRISWSLFWLALGAGVLFVVGHLALRGRWQGQHTATAGGAGLPEKIERHGMGARLFHWVMALSMLVLLITGFLPQIGVQFSWLTLHWVFGLVLVVSIVFHMIHATVVLSFSDIWVSGRDVKEWLQGLRHDLTGSGEAPPKPGKYPVDHKMFHHAATVGGLAAIITGVLMMFRIEDPIFPRDPYMYSDGTWGVIYVLHGIGGVLLVGLTITHVYFAILPEKRGITRSMIKGWITRDEFLEHHDPERWDVGEGDADTDAAPSAAAVSEQG
ncbi:MAG: cytochrome b/b6 domain-containing protein [Acidobacteriota bacterium]|nr:cytochrome b/b6 domain-containing protein [Acidobacteriota bacterium]